MDKFDVVIIGAGSGGLTAAFFAAKLNLKVAIIESNRIGGDCTWHGCVPSKALIHCSKVASYVKSAADYGVMVDSYKVDAQKVHDYVNGAISTVYKNETPDEVEKSGATVILGKASFVSPNELEVACNDGTTKAVWAKKFVLTVGAQPVIPAFLEGGSIPFSTYLDVFGWTEVPESIAVLGGGPIGSELAQAFSRLGAKVYIVASRLMPKEDAQVRQVMEQVFQDEGIELVSGRATGAEVTGKKITVTTSTGASVEVDHLLVSAGRRPNLSSLKLENAKVKYDEKGIVVDGRLRTSAEHIAAAGDCTGGQQFTHLAGFQAFVALRNLVLPLNDSAEALVPRVTFTDPEVGHVGLTEEEHKKKHGSKAKVIMREIKGVDRAICENESRGFFKIMYLPNGRITGATIVCSRAGEILNQMATAIGAKMTVTQLAKVMHAYPSFSFEIQSMAADVASDMAFAGCVGNLYKWLAKRF